MFVIYIKVELIPFIVICECLYSLVFSLSYYVETSDVLGLSLDTGPFLWFYILACSARMCQALGWGFMQWVPHLALAALSPCVRRESEAGKVSEVQTFRDSMGGDGTHTPMYCFSFYFKFS